MAEELLSVAFAPVLMINDNPEIDIRETQLSPASIIVPLRIESAMRACLPYAVTIARKANVDIRIFESKLEYRRNRKLFDRAREYSLEYLDGSGVDYSIRSIRLGMTDTLTVAHRHTPSSWIVMGSRMRRGFTRRFLPSVADNIRREVSCPVLAVPQAEIIPQRRERLKRWRDDWLARNYTLPILPSHLSSHARESSLSERFASLYTYDRIE
jgi:hypothetical protein